MSDVEGRTGVGQTAVDGNAPAAGAAAYDPIDLRRRIAVCFSLPELRKLAQDLGFGESIAWDRGTNEAARDLVRWFERYYGLEMLVAKLREVRPLVEWPEPAVGAATSLPIPPASLPAPPEPAPTVIDPAPASAARQVEPLTPLEPPRENGAASRPPPPPSPVWPNANATTAPRGLDPRILVAVAALTVLAAIIAYFAGRASSATTSAGATAARPAPSDGLAIRAADAMERGLASVARACELPAGTPIDARVLRRALDRCGPPPPRQRTSVIPSQPTDEPPNPPDAADDRPLRPTPPPPEPKGARATTKDPPPVAQGGGSGGCLSACDAEHRSCKSTCGNEPQQSSDYGPWQMCRGRCLSAHSRCRLGCK